MLTAEDEQGLAEFVESGPHNPLMNEVNALTRERDELRAENERLRADNAMLAEERDAWRQAFHRAHEVRGESLKACPLCKVGRPANCP